MHHVIPGAFEISALQDEMTGVSLAGTQLRVNQYNMHDVEWNEVKVIPFFFLFLLKSVLVIMSSSSGVTENKFRL